MADGDDSPTENLTASNDASTEATDTDTAMSLQQAWNDVRPAAEALPEEAIVRPNVIVRDAALLGRRVGDAILLDEETQRDFEHLGATPFFDLRHLRMLPLSARALLYVRAHVDAGVTSAVTVPAPVIVRGKALQGRMLKVVGLYFDEGTPEGDELARHRSALGHAGLAGSLVSLGTLYAKHRKRIHKTPEFYVASDAHDAAAVAEEIYAHLASPAVNEEDCIDRQGRVWTLFVAAYNEVREAGRFMYRHSARLDARFPSLHSLNVARRAPAKKDDEPSEPEENK